MKTIKLKLWLLCSLLTILVYGCSNNVQEDVQENSYKSNEAAEINMRLGIEYMNRGNNDIALDKLRKALRLDSNYAEAHNAIAVLYEKLGEDELAGTHYRQAVQLSPEDSDIQNNYGQYLCSHRQWTEAEAAFLKALDNPVYDKPYVPYTNAAICALTDNRTQQAETYLAKALQSNPKFGIALFQMAKLLYNKGEYKQARDLLKRYVEVAPHTERSLLLGVQIEHSLNNQEAEADYALQLRSKFPDSEEAHSLKQPENP